MPLKETRFAVADNTGITRVACIGIRVGKTCAVGDIITVAVKKATPDARKYWKQRLKAVIVRTVERSRGANRGDVTSFSDNAVVILGNNHEPIGTRISGPISRKVDKNKALPKLVSQLLSMASVVI